MGDTIMLENVSLVRNKKPIVKNINWNVNKGEHWAVLGLNGSGKTTLLNLVMGYSWATTGQVSVLGLSLGKIDLNELRKRIGWVSSSFQERMRPYDSAEDIVISGKHASIGVYESITEKDHERALHLMEQLGCIHLYNRTYQFCSQGERQKLLIARALMAKPELLILDEATTGLDFLSREGLMKGIAEIAKSPEAPVMIFVTHHIEEIMPLFNKTLLIRDGEIFSSGETKEIVSSHALSEFFNMRVNIEWREKRPWIKI
ncbi:iron complex transport system ATP-binding protein [Cytobacillus horneckiae]|uniref:ABC transporter ATP-binding protein n=1 Tax=Cytobacillus horneckiae TaxID=549687 RepID=A0A2N0ZA98_9BACI|nr:ABC transporter ATP-binding protein [Cytobacillus horneckiae]NRG43582.1 ABC transporter ATP-binding protein [Bacillus sp. CRN 9]MBN6886806.1 ABC transporter ATP-binding protein [Cytobacillus horneckiae]MEC1158038.1 ABC transporter ATP-binding protein [Cytobacillus horneckiae]MED2937037.1 ABC transporter ATP-binding protein [Cytobacillus horneckiae]PKG26431.1 ABC transporter ATP-binding protein [Cytobacillus horneckiae]